MSWAAIEIEGVKLPPSVLASHLVPVHVSVALVLIKLPVTIAPKKTLEMPKVLRSLPSMWET